MSQFDSKTFLDKPYIIAPNGEGEIGYFNQKPLYRTDGFDCVTFVMAVIARAQAQCDADRVKWMQRLNYYDSEPCYLKRLHFMSADWLPYMRSLGYVADITPKNTLATAHINRPEFIRRKTQADLYFSEPKTATFLRSRLLELHERADELKAIDASMPYLPFSLLLHENRISDLFQSLLSDHVIMTIVRPNWDLTEKIGTHLNVSHIGFVVLCRGQWYYRQASTRHKKVVDEPLLAYLQDAAKSDTIAGVALACWAC